MDIIKELREHIEHLRRCRDRNQMRYEAIAEELNREMHALEQICNMAEQEDTNDTI